MNILDIYNLFVFACKVTKKYTYLVLSIIKIDKIRIIVSGK